MANNLKTTTQGGSAELTTMKSKLPIISPAATLLAALTLAAISAQAVGFRLPNQDPEAIARGNAFAATADDPSAIYYNPAGITQLEGQSVRAGVYAVTPGIDYTSPTGLKASVKSDTVFVPQIYYVVSPKDFPLS